MKMGVGKYKMANIQNEVLRLFLDQKNYRYGVRSMEAIIQSSIIMGGQLLLSSLPLDAQAKAHWVEATGPKDANTS